MQYIEYGGVCMSSDMHELIKKSNHPDIKEKLNSGESFIYCWNTYPDFRKAYRDHHDFADGNKRGE